VTPVPPMTLRPERFAFVRYPADDPLPVWVFHAAATVWSITRTPNELSVLAPEDDLPPSAGHAERGWRALELDGPIPFEAAGVIASVTAPLAAAGLPSCVVSTHDTDLLLVRERDLPRALELLRERFTVRA